MVVLTHSAFAAKPGIAFVLRMDPLFPVVFDGGNLRNGKAPVAATVRVRVSAKER